MNNENMTDPNPPYIIAFRTFFFTMLFFVTAFAFFDGPMKARAQKTESFKAAVLVSRHIKPYMDALHGLRESLSKNTSLDTSIYIMDQDMLDNPTVFAKELELQQFDILVSIGPEALRFVDHLTGKQNAPCVYTMVLDPKKIVSSPNLLGCGISLSIPVSYQIRDIRQVLPNVERLGLLFNPEENAVFFQQANLQGFLSGLDIVPLKVSSSREIQTVLQNNWNKIDGLWLIPDQTVISQTLVEFIIKEAVVHKKPVVGYNRFFYDSGAAMAFVFDFEQIGFKTADLVLAELHDLACGPVVPSYEVLVNVKVMRRLGMPVAGENL